MKLNDKRFAGGILTLGVMVALSGCGTLGASGPADYPPSTQDVNGPAADYPMVVGAPYSVGDTRYEPADVWNYDEVGYAIVEPSEGGGITAAHHTLPLPSYVEVTSLETGRTILVRVERRGPMDSNRLIALSPAAAVQLGVAQGAPVRVRRVNPPEAERFSLRSGKEAPLRMDTPMSLVEVLTRKLATGSEAQPLEAAPAPPTGEPLAEPEVAPVTAPAPARTPEPLPPLDKPVTASISTEPVETPTATQPEPTPSPTPAPPASEAKGVYVVQAGAFSTHARAEKVAKAIGGHISKSGSLFRVRTGPFVSAAEAEASLAKVRSAGYGDARIFKND